MSNQSLHYQLPLEFVLEAFFLFFFHPTSSASLIIHLYFSITSYSLSGLLDQEFLQEHLCLYLIARLLSQNGENHIWNVSKAIQLEMGKVRQLLLGKRLNITNNPSI